MNNQSRNTRHQSENKNFLFQDNLLGLFLDVSAIYSAIFAVISIFIHHYEVSIILFIYAGTSLIIRFFFRQGKISYHTSAVLFCSTTLFFCLPLASWITGGLFSTVIWWYAVIPIAALLLYGRKRIAYICVAISGLSVIALWLASSNGLVPAYTTPYPVFEHIISVLGLIILNYHLTRIFESQKSVYSDALSEEQQLLVKYTQMVPGVIYQFQLNTDYTTRYPYISQGSMALLELNPEDVKKDANNLFVRMNPDDFKVLRNKLLQSAKNLTIWEYECRMNLPKKGIRWMKGSAMPERQPDGSTLWHGHIYDITEEKNAVRSLQESESSLKHITDTINDVFYLYDIVNKKYLFISPNCKEILGVEDSAFYEGKSYTKKYVHEDDMQKMLEANVLVDSGIKYDIDFRIRIDGEMRWLNEKSFPINDENGATVKNSGIVTDITRRKTAEQLLIQSEAKFREIFENTNELIQNVSLTDDKFIYVNPAWLKAMEYEEAELPGLTFPDIVHPENQEHCSELFGLLLKEPTTFNNIEVTLLSKTGKKIYVEGQLGSAFQDGKPYSTRGLFRDITNRKLANEELIKSQTAFEEAQELASIGSWEVSLFTGEVNWSKQMYRIMDMEGTPKEQLAEAYKQRIHPDDWKIMEQTIDGLIRHGKVLSAEVRIITAKGATKYIMVIAEAVKSKKQQKVIGIKGTLQDITRQKKADMAKNDFLSTMSHEIRTPINGVIGIANLLLDEQLTHTQKEYVNTLQFSANHLLTIVSDILDFSKIESGTFAFEKVPFNLEQVCLGVFKLFEGKAKEKGIGYHFNPAPIEGFSVYWDYVRLSQVLSNLLSNAVKFTHTGSINFSYAVAGETEKHITIEFIIKDTGIGIAANRKDKIFESFSQADNTVTRQYGGTGLGLTISKKLVELQGGKITVDSIAGKGSVFTVLLTFDKYALTDKDTRRDEKSFAPDDIKGMKVLVAEDNKINALVLTRFLRKWGAEYMVAEDGQLALDFLHNQPYDIVLMDLQMPLLDGRAATQKIRESKNEKIKNIPVVALTADALVESHLMLLKTGFNDCITKPFNPDQLLRLLKKYHDMP